MWLSVSDLRNHGLQSAFLLLIVGSAVLGFARPRAWWFWSLALAAWIPAEPMVASLLGMTATPSTNAAAWFLPPLPALVGGFLGRSIARAVKPVPVH
jgi:hypothetical protein